MNEIHFYNALLAGFLSFVSPCVLPLIPAYVSLLLCLSGTESARVKHVMVVSAGFLLGFLLIFLSNSTPSFMGNLVAEYNRYLRILGGALLFFIGVGILSRAWISPQSEKIRAILASGKVIYPITVLIGLGVGSGWTPCIGPTLGVIFLSASTQGTALWGAWTLVLYSIGLAIPFLLMTLIVHLLLGRISAREGLLRAVKVLGGVVVILVGYILITDDLRQLTRLFPDFVNY